MSLRLIGVRRYGRVSVDAEAVGASKGDRQSVFPIKDNIPSRTTPVVNYAILAFCGMCFLFQLAGANRGQIMVERYGMIPARLTHPGKQIIVPLEITERHGQFLVRKQVKHPLPDPPLNNAYVTLITCMFLHGGWMHLLGNLLFLYIFGDNVEDRLGHVGYLAFYLGSGILAGLAHWATEPNSVVPTIGASGAIAGVMGGYFLLYPHARVLTVVWVFFFLEFIVLPAWLMLGVWVVIPRVQGTLAQATPGAGGVAWGAHIGGFAVGAGVMYLLRGLGWVRRPLTPVFPTTARFSAFRGRRPW